MTFVNPLLLGGVALVALPIVLHLIMRQKPRLLEFPALRLVQKRHDTNQRRLRLRHIILLLLRVGAIALLACALARPSILFSGIGSQEAPVAAALVFDTAPRMQYRHENQTRLEAAQDLGLWLLAQLPRESQIAVLDTGYAVKPGPGAFPVDRLAVKERIEHLVTAANARPLSRAVEDALELLRQKEDLPRKEVYIFTDLAEAAWPSDSATQLRQSLAEVPSAAIYMIDVGVEQPINYGLGELQLSGQVLSNRSPLQIDAELSCEGPAERRAVELYLVDKDGHEQKRSEQDCECEPGKSQQLHFRVGGLEPGTQQGLLRIVGQDGLVCDDTRFFTVEIQPAWQVLVVATEPASSHALFFTEALAPTMFRKRGQAPFDCNVVNFDQLAGESLDAYSAVCLLDPPPLERTVWKKLGDFAADGRGVAIFLGRNAMPIDSFNEPAAQELLPGKLLRQARDPAGDLCLAPQDYQHPILADFRELTGAIPWKAFPVFRYWELDQLAKGVNVVVPFSDGRPALLERPLGDGRVLTMTTPVSDDPNRDPWNLLPFGEAWPFLILTNQMASYLVGGGGQQLNYFAGQTALLRLNPQHRYPTYSLSTPDGLSFPVSADPRQNTLVVSATNQVGNYRIRAGGEMGVNRGFSVNYAPGQTQLERISAEALADLFRPYEYRLARTRGEIERDISSGRVGRELFPPLILLVACLLAMEYLVANRFYRQ
jgi:hypothetical protein